MRGGWAWLALFAALALSIAPVWTDRVARAAGPIAVTSTADVLANDGQCTLREATIAANTDTASGSAPGECPAGSGADTIVLQAGTTYTLIPPFVAPDPNPADGDLDISADLAIEAAGIGTATIDGNGTVTGDRVFDINNASVTLTRVTIRGGRADGRVAGQAAGGGGVRALGSGGLSLIDSAVSDNRAPGGGGGGIFFTGQGPLTITRSAISGNIAAAYGGFLGSGGPVMITGSTIADNTATISVGAFDIAPGALTMLDSTVSGNRSPSTPGFATEGAGPHTITGSTISGNFVGGGEPFPDSTPLGGSGFYNSSTLTVTNSTISGNRGPDNQPGIAIVNVDGTLTLVNVTIADNTSGIRRLGGTVTARNTIVAGSTGGPNCAGTITETQGGGYNLDSGNTCGFLPANHSLTDTDPRLYPLGNYGGRTRAYAQRADSPTRDQIPAALCPPADAMSARSTDQRGEVRPKGPTCDIGAVENNPGDVGTVTVTTTGPGTVGPGNGDYAGTVPFTAIPQAGGLFLGWAVDGRFVGFGNPLFLPVAGDRAVAAAFAPRPAFADVPAGSPGEEAIAQLAARGIVKGYADGTFGPGDPVLRAQMAALIARTMGWDGEDHGTSFPDQGSVDPELWRNVGTLAFYGVAKGYADGTYDPTGDVLYAQAVSFIARAMVAKGYWQPQPDDPALYPNVPAGSGHRADIATYVHYAGALPDFPDTGAAFGPWDRPATRAWFASALWQAYEGFFAANRLP